jgi:hypothetical protein
MTQTDVRPDIDISGQSGGDRRPGDRRKPLRGLWLILLLLAMAVAAVVGIAVAAQLADKPAPTRVITQAPTASERGGASANATRPPNANDREDRISSSATRPPNANDREGRVPSTVAQEPNGNVREGRIPSATQPPNANEREGRLAESHS